MKPATDKNFYRMSKSIHKSISKFISIIFIVTLLLFPSCKKDTKTEPLPEDPVVTSPLPPAQPASLIIDSTITTIFLTRVDIYRSTHTGSMDLNIDINRDSIK